MHGAQGQDDLQDYIASSPAWCRSASNATVSRPSHLPARPCSATHTVEQDRCAACGGIAASAGRCNGRCNLVPRLSHARPASGPALSEAKEQWTTEAIRCLLELKSSASSKQAPTDTSAPIEPPGAGHRNPTVAAGSAQIRAPRWSIGAVSTCRRFHARAVVSSHPSRVVALLLQIRAETEAGVADPPPAWRRGRCLVGGRRSDRSGLLRQSGRVSARPSGSLPRRPRSAGDRLRMLLGRRLSRIGPEVQVIAISEPRSTRR